MLNHPTNYQLKALKLDGMAEAFAELQGQESANDLGHAEWLALVHCSAGIDSYKC